MAAVLSACLLALLPLAIGLPAPMVVTRRFPGRNLNAELLVLDHASLSSDLPAKTEQECEQMCKSILGCNGYVYCADPRGCGSGCSNWVQMYPKLGKPSNGQLDYKYQPLPILSFGAFAPRNGCDAKNATRYRRGTCSLKRVSDTTKPRFWPKDGSSWKSGVISMPVPWSCEGKPLGLCELCSSYYRFAQDSPSFPQCMACGTAVTRSLPGGTAQNLEQATAAWSCGWCFTKNAGDVNYNRAQCFACVPKHAVPGLARMCPV